MTGDQAATLRLLMSTTANHPVTASGSEPAAVWTIPHKVIVVAGGRRRAGCSTLAMNLVAEAAHRGIRTVRVGPDVGAQEQPAVKPDFYILDAGASADFEGIADFLVVVARSDREGITGAYLALKRFRRSDPELPAGVVVNAVAHPAEGAEIANRIASAASSFLHGPQVEALGWVLDDPTVAQSSCDAGPVIISSPRSPAASGIRLCARRLWAHWRPRWSTAAA
jgi:hypothetical protein